MVAITIHALLVRFEMYDAFFYASDFNIVIHQISLQNITGQANIHLAGKTCGIIS